MPHDSLGARLRSLEGAPYPAYRDLTGPHPVGEFVIRIDRVQPDPFAAPSRIRIELAPESCSLPVLETRDEIRAAVDFISRAAARNLASDNRTSAGRNPGLAICAPGPEIIERTSAYWTSKAIGLRLTVALPARGRRIRGREAAALLTETLPEIARRALQPDDPSLRALERHIRCVEDQRVLRDQLGAHGLIAFIADGSILPRASGVDRRPLTGDSVVPTLAPESLCVTLDTAHRGPLRGLGIPEGITVITGGGYHGKSTLLQALEQGVFDHHPGDGREHVVTRADAVKVRAEEGRSVNGVPIDTFIGTLPGAVSTRPFHTMNASGSTSQAASVIEALEVGSRLLLLDEDTSAANFMVRDARMQALVREEPITPFLDRVRPLFETRGVSSVVVAGGAGDYLEVAHRVLALERYALHDWTDRARDVCHHTPSLRQSVCDAPLPESTPRWIAPDSLDPGRGRRSSFIRASRRDTLQYGDDEIDLRGVEQLTDPAQTRAIGEALAWLRDHGDLDRHPLAQALEILDTTLNRAGLEALVGEARGELARPRRQEVAAALNRLRKLKARIQPAPPH